MLLALSTALTTAPQRQLFLQPAKALKANSPHISNKALLGPARTPIDAPGTSNVTPGIALNGRLAPTAPAVLQLGAR